MKNQILKLSATQAARRFSKLLDRIEAGAEVIVERRARPVAFIVPAEIAPRRISECLAVPVARRPAVLDARFARDLEEVIAGHPVGEPPSWE